MSKSPVIGPPVRRTDGITEEQELRLRELGHIGFMPWTQSAAERLIRGLEAEQARKEAQALAQDDFGPCTVTGCLGRRIRRVVSTSPALVGFAVVTCNCCGEERVL